MLIPLIIFIFYNVKIVFKKWEIKRVVVVVVVINLSSVSVDRIRICLRCSFILYSKLIIRLHSLQYSHHFRGEEDKVAALEATSCTN